jgi:hypothetical protein
MSQETYQNGSAYEDQVPDKIFSSRQPRMTSFQPTHVDVHVESVEQDTQVWQGDQEACYEAP